MSAPAWPRPNWQDSGARAFLLWFVFGDFPSGLVIDGERYRTRGTPAGIEVTGYANRALAQWDGYPLAGALGASLWHEDTPLFEAARSAGQCQVLRGEIADPRDLDFLRDLTGTIAALADQGAAAIVDPQALAIIGPAEWLRRHHEDRFEVREHVAILSQDEPTLPGHRHVHSRGLRKFARPDLSLRGVPEDQAGAAGEIVRHLARWQALGGILPEGYAPPVEGLPGPLTLSTAGEADQQAFSNRVLTADWPRPGPSSGP